MEEIYKEILTTVKIIEKRIKELKEKEYENNEIKKLEEFVNKNYKELLKKVDEEIEKNRIDHRIYEAEIKKLEAGQKYLKSKLELYELCDSI